MMGDISSVEERDVANVKARVRFPYIVLKFNIYYIIIESSLNITRS